ncbi:MAG: hypothetical protein ACJ79R_09020 [Anaeromyxobacteraceae bacterium]
MVTRTSAVVVGLVAVGLSAGAAADGIQGRYVLHGPAHVETTTFGSHDATADLDVVVSAGRGPSALRLELTSGAYACTLAARATPAGDLTLDPGQLCPVDVAEEGARGRVEAKLSSGGGRVAGGTLALDLAFDLTGTLSVGARGGKVTVLGADLEVPGAWTAPAPLRGTASATARGTRQRGG